jgi:hypothetical protein
MKYSILHNNRKHSIDCDNVRNLHRLAATLIPEINDYSNFRYNISVLAIGEEVKFIVNMVIREQTQDALLFERLWVTSPATHFVRVSPIFDKLQEAIDHFHDMCSEFQKHTGIKLHVTDNKGQKRTNSKKKTERFSSDD